MTTIHDLRAAAQLARRDTDRSRQLLLTTLIGELEADAKMVDGAKVVTDAEVQAKAKKFLKGINQILDLRPGDTDALFEKSVLESILPQQMSDDETSIAIGTIIDDLKAGSSPVNMGVVMKALKDRFGGLYDGKTASGLVKAALAT